MRYDYKHEIESAKTDTRVYLPSGIARIDPEAAMLFIEPIDKNPYITDLNLERADFWENPQVLDLFAKLVKNKEGLTSVKWTGNDLVQGGTKGIQAVVDAHKEHPTITHVGLRRNQIGEDVEVTRIVASLIKENEIATSYDLLGNKLAESKEVAKIIADALMANKVITSCDLTGNGLEDADIAKNKEGAEIFASMIAKCCIEERNLELKIGEYAFNTNDVSTIHGMKDEDIKAKIFEKIEAQMSNETKPSEVHQLGSVDKYKNKQDVVQYYKN